MPVFSGHPQPKTSRAARAEALPPRGGEAEQIAVGEEVVDYLEIMDNCDGTVTIKAKPGVTYAEFMAALEATQETVEIRTQAAM